MQENTLPPKSICCFGELLLRFSPEMRGVFIQKNSMPVFVGGAELNAATALALWQQPVKYVTALPDNYLTAEIEDFIQEVANGRVYDGVHFRNSAEVGTAMGRKIGQLAVSKFLTAK